MTLYVGTSGWAYPEWKPVFYPEKLPQSRFLEHYARVFDAVEVNATFYSRRSDDVIRRWAETVHDGFRFCLKAHRLITHGRSIAPEGPRGDYLNAFIASTRLLADKKGPVLFQFPPQRERDEAALSSLLGALPADLPFALEFRHSSWDGVEDLVAAAGGTVCLSDSNGDPPTDLPPGPSSYVRLRGSSYSDEQKDAWLRLLSKQDRDVYVFAKHEGVAAGDEDAGLGLARRLAHAEALG